MHGHKLTVTPACTTFVHMTLIHPVKGPEKEFGKSEGDYSNDLSNSSNQEHSKALPHKRHLRSFDTTFAIH